MRTISHTHARRHQVFAGFRIASRYCRSPAREQGRSANFSGRDITPAGDNTIPDQALAVPKIPRRSPVMRNVVVPGQMGQCTRVGVGLTHWYLAVLGSDTVVRGKGYGQALMQSRLDRVDAEHAPAYLESSKAENVPYYQRFGFEVTSEIVSPKGVRRCGRCGGRRAEYRSRTRLCEGS
jgi:GNAT superfamily N-acetyltransferase